MAFLKYHPFAVEAFFKSSLVLTYAFPKEELAPLIPACLTLDTFDNRWAFVAVAMVQTKSLRPKGFPAWMGNDFFLAGYRIFVRYTTSYGKKLRGLYILRSETDNSRMVLLGNVFTNYHYTKTDIHYQQHEQHLSVISNSSGISIQGKTGDETTPLPAGSPFRDWKEARRFAGPLPHTFSFDNIKKQVLIIEGVREHWIPQPVELTCSRVGFIEKMKSKHVLPANAFIIRNVPYYWKKGKTDLWTQQ